MARFGEVLEKVLATGAICQCGTPVGEGDRVEVWVSRLRARRWEPQKVVSCHRCKKPRALLAERKWLGERLEQAHKAGAQPDVSWCDEALLENYARTDAVLLKLVVNLPHCSECDSYATHCLATGASFYCDAHALEHPTAQKVAWLPQLLELGLEDLP